MRDFNARDINGDVIIQDNSTEYKQLDNCSNEELIAEEKHRHKVLDREKRKKYKFIFFALLVSAIAFLVAAAWASYKGKQDLFSILLGASSIVIAVSSLKGFGESSVFEERQLAALYEINTLLRERLVR